jgi:hypothetical protein
MRRIELPAKLARNRKLQPRTFGTLRKWVCNSCAQISVVSLLICFSLIPQTSQADVFDISIADVTTRSFSVVWVSDEPVLSATLRVFADADGITDLTPSLTIDTVSAALPPAHDRGIVKVSVAGLSAEQVIYVQTVTDTATGQAVSPATAPFLGAVTAFSTTRVQPGGAVIASDLIQHVVVNPLDGVTPTAGTLVLLKIPGLGSSPLSAIAGENGFTDSVINLNNYRDDGGTNIAVPVDEIFSITEYRGLLCAGLDKHKLVRFRRHPDQPGLAMITELKTPPKCFFADTVCDDEVNVLDFQFILNSFSRTLGECGFNQDFDIVTDNVINILDVQSVLNRFGQQAPFL